MKRFLSLFLLAAILAFSAAGCESSQTTSSSAAPASSAAASSASGSKKLKIGVTVQSLSNQVWSVACTTMKKLADADGNTLSYMSCDDTSSKQIEQIENFISGGCDVIMVNPSDPNAIEDVCKQARDAGIKVMCWDNTMKNTDINWVIDNQKLGYMIGEQASTFINSKFKDGNVEVAVLDYPQTAILLEREKGILQALKEKSPNAKVVAQQPALNATQGLDAMETILQAHPNVKVVCCIGGGGAVGANEALKAANKIADDVGIFAADATDQELASMLSGEANRMSVIITGTPTVIGQNCYQLLTKLGSGGKFDNQNVYREIFPVTAENASQYYKK
ncbi:sugar ABC transporter substrate-binding protein [Caproiciproducens sp. NJN-50]|uniref:sugar ABC transporter substrate-binding protein n=1 Tax=Acutalibacteraceae TaxID=3082771 RepID=UPI000FFE1110|nr:MULTISPECIES: sugar ABC transporter substrate-binding protein [Acutalibacteraceae]QAT50309.1 sugar ABC transporter substrate-binding protein [Caproiciproducens sp. NJN-50]